MKYLWMTLLFSILILSSLTASAKEVDLSGTWESEYAFGPEVVEVMVAEIQQEGQVLMGSFEVTSSTGDEYSGVLHGSIEGERVKAYYISINVVGGKLQPVSVTYTDSSVVNENKLEGTYSVLGIDLSGPFEANKI